MLTAAQISNLYNGVFPPPYPPPQPSPPPPPTAGISGLYLWYSAAGLTPGASTATDFLVDRSGNGRTGTVVSATGLSVTSDAPGTAGISSTCPRSLVYLSGTTASQLTLATLNVATISWCLVERRAQGLRLR